MRFKIGDKVLCKYVSHGLQRWYPAKILKQRTKKDEPEWFIHYHGWNTRHDQWVPDRLLLIENDENKAIDRFEEKCALFLEIILVFFQYSPTAYMKI